MLVLSTMISCFLQRIICKWLSLQSNRARGGNVNH